MSDSNEPAAANEPSAAKEPAAAKEPSVAKLAASMVGQLTGDLVQRVAGGLVGTLATRVIGTWRFVSLKVGDEKVEPFGEGARGMMVMDGQHFMITILRGDLAPFTSGNREQGSAAENAAAVRGAIAYFGTYKVDASAHAITALIEGSTFPNYVGQEQTRQIAVEGDTLTYINPNPSAGGGIAEAVWKRA